MQLSSSQIIQYTMSKIEKSFLELGCQIESNFSEIDELIDSIFIIPFRQVTHTVKSKLEIPQLPEFSISKFDNSQQTHESLKPLLNKIIQNRIEVNQQKLTQTNFEQKIIQEEQENNILTEEIDTKNQQIKQSDNLLNEIEIKGSNQVDNEQKQLEQQLMMHKQVHFQLIDDKNQQSSQCYSIVFNQDGSIIITTQICDIKIWNFEIGRFQLSNSYSKHRNPIKCLVYSKKTNNFISGCAYHEIICCQQINQNEWKYSQPFKQHSGSVNCLMLNDQEDQLISGGSDHKIIVWQIDFQRMI
ncbi:unnamed protein product [Paramecium pentaurelia]|uniref:WD domain, G-beta repeat protein n=1 Tax=Paramecium pentaurelia TaxID=43138 RepID=A0A8S1URB9_9CILI|nr:unnamed protein product [Paramecium pentaurelia]